MFKTDHAARTIGDRLGDIRAGVRCAGLGSSRVNAGAELVVPKRAASARINIHIVCARLLDGNEKGLGICTCITGVIDCQDKIVENPESQATRPLGRIRSGSMSRLR